MNARRSRLLALSLLGAAFLLGALAAPQLPNPLVSNWGADGTPTDTIAKWTGLFLLPVVGALFVGFLAVLPRIDPLGKNYESFRDAYNVLGVVFALFFAGLHVVIIAYNLGYVIDVLRVVTLGAAGLYYVAGMVLQRAKRNWFVGIQTPWTMTSDRVWERTHALGGRLFKLSALVALVGLFLPEYAIFAIVAPAVFTAITTVVYSFVVYEDVENGASEP